MATSTLQHNCVIPSTIMYLKPFDFEFQVFDTLYVRDPQVLIFDLRRHLTRVSNLPPQRLRRQSHRKSPRGHDAEVGAAFDLPTHPLLGQFAIRGTSGKDRGAVPNRLDVEDQSVPRVRSIENRFVRLQPGHAQEAAWLQSVQQAFQQRFRAVLPVQFRRAQEVIAHYHIKASIFHEILLSPIAQRDLDVGIVPGNGLQHVPVRICPLRPRRDHGERVVILLVHQPTHRVEARPGIEHVSPRSFASIARERSRQPRKDLIAAALLTLSWHFSPAHSA
mmetsp:Transcript_34864/g.74323  ORF Transcript_34864/g.74323 Transcript_34864/m.74323 type:complete len:277 (+) Transcript_34864:405-1235(+)